jgi:hypothetical protein
MRSVLYHVHSAVPKKINEVGITLNPSSSFGPETCLSQNWGDVVVTF